MIHDLLRLPGQPDDPAPIRLPLPQDANNVRLMARAAHPQMSADDLARLGKLVTTKPDDETVWTVHSASLLDSRTFDVPWLRSIRVIGRPAQQAKSFVHCAPPVDWIMAQRQLTTEDRCRLSAALVEVMLLGTMTQHRGRGYGTRLLRDAEERYAAAGYAAVFATVRTERAGVIDGLRGRGYTIGAPGVAPLLYPWADPGRASAVYDYVRRGVHFAVKALTGRVIVDERGGLVIVSGLLADEPTQQPA